METALFVRPVHSFRLILPTLIALAATASACGGSGNTTTGPSTQRAEISSVSPSSIQPSFAPQTLRFEGVDFGTGMELTVVGPDGTTTSFREPALEALQATSFQVALVLSQTGVYRFQIETAAGVDSGVFTVVVQPATGTLPTVASVTPSSVTRSQQSTNISIIGSNFDPAAEVLVTLPNGATSVRSSGSVSFQSSSRLDVSIVLDAQGLYTFAVRNPNGDTSNSGNVTVN